MCGRFSVLTFEEVAAVAEAVERRLAAPGLELSRESRGQAFPGSSVSVIVPNARGEVEVSRATWGFPAEWNKRLVFNTRIESAVSGTAMWRSAVENGRCIIPVASFFEPHATETIASPRTGRPMKRPYEFTEPAGAPLLLAGLQENGRCSIVTCMPNSWAAPIHNRMPLVMRFSEVSTWLTDDWATLADRAGIELRVEPELLQPPESAGANSQSNQLSLF